MCVFVVLATAAAFIIKCRRKGKKTNFPCRVDKTPSISVFFSANWKRAQSEQCKGLNETRSKYYNSDRGIERERYQYKKRENGVQREIMFLVFVICIAHMRRECVCVCVFVNYFYCKRRWHHIAFVRQTFIVFKRFISPKHRFLFNICLDFNTNFPTFKCRFCWA